MFSADLLQRGRVPVDHFPRRGAVIELQDPVERLHAQAAGEQDGRFSPPQVDSIPAACSPADSPGYAMTWCKPGDSADGQMKALWMYPPVATRPCAISPSSGRRNGSGAAIFQPSSSLGFAAGLGIETGTGFIAVFWA